ncbi:MAG: tRNA (guanosine(37)-N1)-methyltransferase TrmD [Methylococcaceae bacterium]|nr:tRNA (guanosine(37)-N1)-methyltransferase TrmD [Methylococcaceae bacterium]
MRFDVVTLFPEMVNEVARHGVTGRALQRGLAELVVWNPRDFAQDRYRRVDDRPYGGGPGMVMKVEPLRSAIRAARDAAESPAPVLLMSPQGNRLDQEAVRRFASLPRLVLVAGRYEGIDERLVETEIDQEWSLGDYVLSGGELAALVMFDAVVRLLPGVLGDDESSRQDSYMEGLLDCPHYTRPDEIDGLAVPAVLQGGDHEAIRRWRLKQALGRTWLRRPELLERKPLDGEQRRLLEEFKNER